MGIFFVNLHSLFQPGIISFSMSKNSLYLFSPSHKRGFFVLFLIIFLILMIRVVGGVFRKDSLGQSLVFPDSAKVAAVVVFVNTADSASWEKLPGIGQKLSARIVKYREKIGGFKDLSQISEVYGLKPETYALILPQLRLDSIPSDLRRGNVSFNGESNRNSEAIPHLNINTASAEDFEKLPGIGAVLSERIVKFRDSRRTGFQSVTDIQQVYGISQETFEAILPYLHLVRKEPGYIQDGASAPAVNDRNVPENRAVAPPKTTVVVDLNVATAEELKSVPGIGEKTAARILEFRNEIGGFARVEHLRAVWGVTEENYEKMKPLLKVSALGENQKKSLNHIGGYALGRYPFMEREAVGRFITYRKLNGFFKNWGEVEKADGVTPEMIEVLKDYFILK